MARMDEDNAKQTIHSKPSKPRPAWKNEYKAKGKAHIPDTAQKKQDKEMISDYEDKFYLLGFNFLPAAT